MKFKTLIILLAACYLMIALSSCKDSQEDPLPELKSELYSSSKLALSYEGSEMPGKLAKLDIGADGKTAVVTFGQTLDLSQISGLGLEGELTGPGVVPGSVTLSLPLTLTAGDGRYLFSGSGETENISFDYQGSIASDKLTFSFSDCRLKSQIFAGRVFSPMPIVKNNEFDYTSIPFHLEWQLDPAAGVEIPLTQILRLIAVAPVIPVYQDAAYTSIAQLFESVVKTIALLPSGNIPMMYVSTLGGAAHISTSNPTMMQYMPFGNGLKLFLNPLQVYSEFLLVSSNNKDNAEFDFERMLSRPAASRSEADETSAPELSEELKKAMIASLLKALAPQIAGGIPLTVGLTAEGADIYFDTATSVTFLATLLQDMMQNPQIAGALQQYLAGVNQPGVDPEKLAGLLQMLPSYLQATTKLEIGLALKAVAAS